MRRLAVLLMIVLAPATFAASKLSREAARKRISELAQFKLLPDAIEIRRIVPEGSGTAIVETTVTLAFQFRKNKDDVWTVDAVRLGDRDWVHMDELLAAIYHGHPPVPAIATNPLPPKRITPIDKFHVNSSEFEKERRSMIELGASPLVPGAIEIRRVITESDVRTIAECTVTMGFRFRRSTGKGDWRIDAARLGDREWIDTRDLLATLDEGRRRDTLAMMQTLAAAIEKYSLKKGSLPVARDIVELSDLLHPDYITELIRLDAWEQPLEYSSSGSAYRLVSRGADGRWGTGDDISVGQNLARRP